MNQEALEKYKEQIEEEIEKNREQLRKVNQKIDKIGPLLYWSQVGTRALFALALLFLGDCALAYVVHTLAITNIGVIGTILLTVAPLGISYLIATGLEKTFHSRKMKGQEAKTDVERHQDMAMMEVEKNQLINRNKILESEQAQIDKETHLLSKLEENYTIIPKERKNPSFVDSSQKIKTKYKKLDDLTRQSTLAEYFRGGLSTNIQNAVVIGVTTLIMTMMSLYLICIPAGSIAFAPVTFLLSSLACGVIGGTTGFKACNNKLKAYHQLEETYGKEYMGKTRKQAEYQEEIFKVQHQITSLRMEQRHQIITGEISVTEEPVPDVAQDTMKDFYTTDRMQTVDEQVEKENSTRGKTLVKNKQN